MEEPKFKKHNIKRENPFSGRNDGPGPAPDSVRPDNIPYSTSIKAHKGFCDLIKADVNAEEAVKKAQEKIDETTDKDFIK